MFPQLELTGVYNDNVTDTAISKQADGALRVAPSARLQSNWSRHSLTASAASEHYFYLDHHEFNETSLNSQANLRLDIRRDTQLELASTYILAQTPPSSGEVPGNAAEKRDDHEFSASARLIHRANRFITSLRLGARAFKFGNVKLIGGGTENNSDRDYIEPSAALRLAYESSPAITTFLEAGYAPRFHHKKIDRNGQKRNSKGFTTSLGLRFNPSPVWSGEAALVYEYRKYEDKNFKTASNIGATANINWRPSNLTQINLLLDTSLDESSVSGVAGTRNYDVTLTATHKFRENLTGTLSGSINYDDFIDSPGDDVYFTVSAGVSYVVHRNMEWIANYTMTHLKSGVPSASYTQNLLSTGIRFRL